VEACPASAEKQGSGSPAVHRTGRASRRSSASVETADRGCAFAPMTRRAQFVRPCSTPRGGRGDHRTKSGWGSGWRPDVVAASYRQAETTQFNKWSRPHDALRARRGRASISRPLTEWRCSHAEHQ
jgi:hypothetical protein